MNESRNKLSIGDNYKTPVKFSQEQVNLFAEVSGDNNPLHLDPAYAQKTPFKKPIVHGFLTGSVFSKVIGTEFPGRGSIYVSQSMQFKRPVYVDTEYIAYFEITEINEKRQIGKMACSIKTLDDKVVLEGIAEVKNTALF